MKTLAIIPARWGSKRVPGKLLKRVGHQTLLGRAIRVGQEVADAVVVSTDGEPVLREARVLGADVHFWPHEIGDEEMPHGREVAAYGWAAGELGAFDRVVRLFGTCPFRRAIDVQRGLDLHAEHGGRWVSVSRAPFHQKQVVDAKGRWAYIPGNGHVRSQDADPVLYVNGVAYIQSVADLLRGDFIDGAFQVWETPSEFAVDIDTPDDLEAARAMAGAP